MLRIKAKMVVDSIERLTANHVGGDQERAKTYVTVRGAIVEEYADPSRDPAVLAVSADEIVFTVRRNEDGSDPVRVGQELIVTITDEK
jgi:hypothetical protein